MPHLLFPENLVGVFFLNPAYRQTSRRRINRQIKRAKDVISMTEERIVPVPSISRMKGSPADTTVPTSLPVTGGGGWRGSLDAKGHFSRTTAKKMILMFPFLHMIFSLVLPVLSLPHHSFFALYESHISSQSLSLFLSCHPFFVLFEFLLVTQFFPSLFCFAIIS